MGRRRANRWHGNAVLDFSPGKGPDAKQTGPFPGSGQEKTRYIEDVPQPLPKPPQPWNKPASTTHKPVLTNIYRHVTNGTSTLPHLPQPTSTATTRMGRRHANRWHGNAVLDFSPGKGPGAKQTGPFPGSGQEKTRYIEDVPQPLPKPPQPWNKPASTTHKPVLTNIYRHVTNGTSTLPHLPQPTSTTTTRMGRRRANRWHGNAVLDFSPGKGPGAKQTGPFPGSGQEKTRYIEDVPQPLPKPPQPWNKPASTTHKPVLTNIYRHVTNGTSTLPHLPQPTSNATTRMGRRHANRWHGNAVLDFSPGKGPGAKQAGPFPGSGPEKSRYIEDVPQPLPKPPEPWNKPASTTPFRSAPSNRENPKSTLTHPRKQGTVGPTTQRWSHTTAIPEVRTTLPLNSIGDGPKH
ncbi:hypothetical protein APED_33505 [Acanthopleuribacter pedis]